MNETTAASARLERVVTGVFLGSFVMLLGIGAPFVLEHRATHPAQVVAPFVAVAVLLGLLASLPRRAWDEVRRRAPKWAGLPLGIAAMAWSLHFAHHRPGAYVSVLFLVLLPSLVALAWSRASGRIEPILAAVPFLFIAIVLFAAELPFRAPVFPRVRWGSGSTFATGWPVTPPYIGPGGRLRANLDVYMESAEMPQGAHLVTNGSGFRNVAEIPETPAPGELRILSLGDSFSIGMQVDQTHFFGAALETQLRAAMPERRVTVANAEVSDPAFGLYYLQNSGVRYQPDVVLLGLCGNDMLQAENFVGEDRFFQLDDTGTLVPSPGRTHGDAIARYRDFAYPMVCDRALARSGKGDRILRIPRYGHKLAESARKTRRRLLQFRVFRALFGTGSGPPPPALMHSYAAEYERADGRMRLLDGTANLGYFYRKPAPVVDTLYERLFEVLDAMDATARAAGARFVLVLHPQRFQVVEADWAVIREAWCLNDADFDLEQYNTRVRAFCADRGILCVDLLDAFRSAAGERGLYLPRGDMHFNRAGHAVAAEHVARALLASLGG